MTKAAKILEKYIEYMGELNVDGVASLFADDIVQKIPFAPGGAPDVISGKDAVMQNFAGLPSVFNSMKYSDIEIVECKDDNLAVGFAHADAVLFNGEPYHQNCVFYVHINNDEKIDRYREYMNTQEQAKVFAALAGK